MGTSTVLYKVGLLRVLALLVEVEHQTMNYTEHIQNESSRVLLFIPAVATSVNNQPGKSVDLPFQGRKKLAHTQDLRHGIQYAKYCKLRGGGKRKRERALQEVWNTRSYLFVCLFAYPSSCRLALSMRLVTALMSLSVRVKALKT